jgi:hypothetical protein
MAAMSGMGGWLDDEALGLVAAGPVLFAKG